jgi:response regulator RpfG family c-di-GMP phosphodiesterase
MSRDAALGQLSEGRGAQFDPRIVDLFMGHIGEIEEIGDWPNRSEGMEVA